MGVKMRLGILVEQEGHLIGLERHVAKHQLGLIRLQYLKKPLKTMLEKIESKLSRCYGIEAGAEPSKQST